MAKLAKPENPQDERRGAIVPVRAQTPAFPLNVIESIDQLFGERWTPWWARPSRAEHFLKVPPVDVYEEGEALVLKAELPGLKKEEINVEIAGHVVTISGKKEKEERVEKKDYHRYERASGSFSRSVTLPAEVQLDKVTAQLKDGVLEVRAPKTEAAKAKTQKIEVV